MEVNRRAEDLAMDKATVVSAANIYYPHLLLDVMGRDLGISSSTVGLIVTLTQVAYGLGLVFIVSIAECSSLFRGCCRQSLSVLSQQRQIKGC